MIQCASCGTINPDTVPLCTNCHAQLRHVEKPSPTADGAEPDPAGGTALLRPSALSTQDEQNSKAGDTASLQPDVRTRPDFEATQKSAQSAAPKPAAKRRPTARQGGAYATGTLPATIPTPHGEPKDLNRSIVIVSASGKLVGFNVRTGQMVWWTQLTYHGQDVFDFVIFGSTIFASTTGRLLFCIDYLTGRTQWTAPLFSGQATILVDGSHLFIADGDYVCCYNLHGYQLWSQHLPGMGSSRTTIALPGNIRRAVTGTGRKGTHPG